MLSGGRNARRLALALLALLATGCVRMGFDEGRPAPIHQVDGATDQPLSDTYLEQGPSVPDAGFIGSLDVAENIKKELLAITPQTYTGLQDF